MEITKFIHSNRDRAFLIGDYSTYRTQLSRQLLKLRKQLGRATPKNQKQPSTKTAITAQDVASNHLFVQLELLTAERAWAFAMAMKAAQGEGEQAMPGSTRSHVLSRLAKAARAADHLADLLRGQQSTTKAKDTDVLEAAAYAAALHGSHEFEKHVSKAPSDDTSVQKATWAPCLKHYAVAHVLYSALLHATKREVFKEVLASVDPSIRYAAYQARYGRSVAPNQIAKQHFPRSDSALVKLVESLHPAALSNDKQQAKVEAPDGALKDIPTTITWRGRTAPIADARIGQSLATTSLAIDHLQVEVARLSKDKPGPHTPKMIGAAYDPVLNAAQETVDNVRAAIVELTSEGIAESDSRMQDLRVTDLAVNYELIAWRVGRNRVLFSSAPAPGDKQDWQRDDGLRVAPTQRTLKPKSKRADRTSSAGAAPASQKSTAPRQEPVYKQLQNLTARIALFDATLQSIDSASMLRGAARDTGFQSELAARRAYFSCLRSLNIAASYKLLGREREALALMAAAQKKLSNNADSAPGDTGGLEALKLGISTSQMEALTSHIQTATRKQHGLVVLQEQIQPLAAHKIAEKNSIASKAGRRDPLINHLDTYPADGKVDLTNLVQYPPKVEAVPVKPIFLDLAWNYIDYPGRKPEEAAPVIQEEPKEDVKEKKRGWFGFGRS